jgi:restriction endonuclease Mrr
MSVEQSVASRTGWGQIKVPQWGQVRVPFPDAKREATRDGAPPVDLIDGDRLCDLLKEYELGVRLTVRQIEDVAVSAEFFADL